MVRENWCNDKTVPGDLESILDLVLVAPGLGWRVGADVLAPAEEAGPGLSLRITWNRERDVMVSPKIIYLVPEICDSFRSRLVVVLVKFISPAVKPQVNTGDRDEPEPTWVSSILSPGLA